MNLNSFLPSKPHFLKWIRIGEVAFIDADDVFGYWNDKNSPAEAIEFLFR